LNLQLAGDRLAGLAETEVLAHTKLIDLLCHMLLGVLRELPDLPPAEAYTPLWRTRALGTRALAQRHSAKNDSPEATQLRAEMEQIQRQLSALVLAPPQPGFGAVRSRKLAELSRRKEELQRKLLEMSAGFRREQSLDQASWTDLAAVLPPDTAIVDVIMAIMTRPGEDPFKIDPDFEAFVLRRADEPPGYRLTWVHLGKARPIQDAIENWREQIALEYEPRRFSERFCKPLDPDDGREGTLRALVWEKLEPHLAGCRTVVVLPDGGLARLPWAALPGKKPGTFLIDEYAIATAAYGQQVLDLLTRAAPADGPPLLVGGVVHGAPGGETHAGPKPPDPKPAAAEPQALFQRGTGLAWEDLKGARAEVEMIARLWPREARPKLISGRGADEDTLRRELPGARYIHLATHGFFADDAFRARRRHDTAGESLVPAGAALAPRLSITGRNPLVLSGLVLARANLPPEVDENGLPTGRDGLLTGEEVVSLDLRKAELVVLSACDSGLGDERLGEGVFGLQRAFSLAGARASIATLWAAEDAAARSLMAEFYTQLWTKGAGKLEALRAAQLAMIYGYDPTTQRLVPRGAGGVDTLPNLRQGTILPPFYWASFVLHGDWR
jgi:CHAT domain-containing protein